MKTYVIHVSDAYEREKYIKNQLKDKNLDVQFVNDGDKSTLNEKILEKFFSGEMKQASGATSCAYKHILAYEYFLKTDEAFAFVVEDDLRLYKNFASEFPQLLTEIKKSTLRNFMLSVEDSDLRFIPKSQRKKGKRIYETQHGTTTAAYIIDRTAAENILNFLQKTKMSEPIDWFHTKCIREGVFSMFRSYPPLGSQGTFDGTTASLISNNRVGFLRIISYKLQKKYKKLLYEFR